MSDTAAIALTVGLIAIISGIMFSRMLRSERKTQSKAAAAAEQFEARLASPNLEVLEQRNIEVWKSRQLKPPLQTYV